MSHLKLLKGKNMSSTQRYKYSKDDYYRITNADGVAVAQALGLQVDEGKQTTAKAVHIKNSGGLYIFPTNNWYRHSDGSKGFPVELVMDILECDRENAMEFIAKNVLNGIQQLTLNSQYRRPMREEKPVEFKVPQHDIKPNRVYAYLIKSRGIDKDIVGSLIQNKMIAEDSQRHNCLFFGRDENGEIKSCAMRGTSTYVQFRGEVAGGDKSCSFAMNGKGTTLRLFESPIDAMSHATFSKLLGKDWTADHRLSTNGCGYQSVLNYLSRHPEIESVVISYDNDVAGRKGARETAAKLSRDFPDRGLRVTTALPREKDWNEELLEFRGAESNGITARQFVEAKYYRQEHKEAAPENVSEDYDDEESAAEM